MGNAEFWSGVAGGLLTAVIAWVLVHWVWTPTILWSEKIGIRPRAAGDVRRDFRVKMKNASRIRRVVDIRVQAYVTIGGLEQLGKDTLLIVRLRASAEDVAHLYPQQNRVITLELGELTPVAERRLREVGKQSFLDLKDPSLRDYFRINPGRVKLRFVALVVDGLTGVLHVRESKAYTEEDLQYGPFADETDSLNKFNRRWAQRVRRRINGHHARRARRDSSLQMSGFGWEDRRGR